MVSLREHMCDTLWYRTGSLSSSSLQTRRERILENCIPTMIVASSVKNRWELWRRVGTFLARLISVRRRPHGRILACLVNER